MKLQLYLLCLGLTFFMTTSQATNISQIFKQVALHSKNLLPSAADLMKTATGIAKNFDDRLTDKKLPIYEEETTTQKLTWNITLDTVDDITRDWTISRTNVKKWFEYYNDTSQLQEAVTDTSVCAHIVSSVFLNELAEVNGIWAACKDPSLPEDCFEIPNFPCHPMLKYTIGNSIIPLSTVKIHLFLRGFAILRLTFFHRCFDYSRHKDPFSHCDFVRIKNTSESGWQEVQSDFNGYTGQTFNSFTIQLIARFQGDIVLVDKVEATDYLLCGDSLCTTTPAGPTKTYLPAKAMTTAATTTSTTTLESTTTTGSLGTTTVPPKITTLDTEQDVEMGSKWGVADIIPKWMDYYTNPAAIISQADNKNLCASIIAPTIKNLNDTNGIWSSCQNLPNQAFTHERHFMKNSSSTYAFIHYSSKTELIVSITIKFYLHNSAVLRLHTGNACVDYSVANVSFSPCKFFRIRQDDVFWRGVFWSANNWYPDQLKQFRIELISISPEDVVLLDKVEVKYKSCDGEDCSQHVTTMLTTLTTEKTTVTDIGCQTSENSATTYESSTEGSENPVATESNTKGTEITGTTDEDTNCSTSTNPSATPNNSSTSCLKLFTINISFCLTLVFISEHFVKMFLL